MRMHIPVLIRRTGLLLTKNSPMILTGLGVIGVFGTVVFAIHATPKATLLLAELEDEQADKYENDEIDSPVVPKLEAAKRVLPVYIPTIAMALLTSTCIIGASAVHSRRNAVLAGLYSATEMALQEYQDKVVSTLGPKKELALRDEIEGDRVRNHPVTSSQIVITGRGESLFLDSLSGRYFKSDIESIRKIENEMNREIIREMWVTLNQLYGEIGLEAIELGDDIGWNNDHPLEFRFSSQITEDDRPCLVLLFVRKPKNYRN